MSANQRSATASFLQKNWEGFLPSRALVMAKRRAPQAAAPQTTAAHQSTPSQNLAEATTLEPSLQSLPEPTLLSAGHPHAELVFVAKNPDGPEYVTGRPFAGPAGDLLVKMIEALGLKREQVHMLNIVMRESDGLVIREPNGLDPATDSSSCGPLLQHHLDQIQPKIVVALGHFATQALQSYRGVRVVSTLHPFDLLLDPASKRKAWADLQLVAAELGISVPKKPNPKA